MFYIAAVRHFSGFEQTISGNYPSAQIFRYYLSQNGYQVHFITTPQQYQLAYYRYMQRLSRQRVMPRRRNMYMRAKRRYFGYW